MSESKDNKEHPTCHFTPMDHTFADDIGFSIEYWECSYCGHVKEICKHAREG